MPKHQLHKNTTAANQNEQQPAQDIEVGVDAPDSGGGMDESSTPL
jgi:hypothetical protein